MGEREGRGGGGRRKDTKQLKKRGLRAKATRLPLLVLSLPFFSRFLPTYLPSLSLPFGAFSRLPFCSSNKHLVVSLVWLKVICCRFHSLHTPPPPPPHTHTQPKSNGVRRPLPLFLCLLCVCLSPTK